MTIHADVGHEERERIGLAAERDAGLLSDDAVGTLAADQPLGLDRVQRVAAANLREDRIGILAVADELCLPFDVAPKLPVVAR